MPTTATRPTLARTDREIAALPADADMTRFEHIRWFEITGKRIARANRRTATQETTP